jgi:hypothetical protein
VDIVPGVFILDELEDGDLGGGLVDVLGAVFRDLTGSLLRELGYSYSSAFRHEDELRGGELISLDSGSRNSQTKG